jgi:hypothetical protein
MPLYINFATTLGFGRFLDLFSAARQGWAPWAGSPSPPLPMPLISDAAISHFASRSPYFSRRVSSRREAHYFYSSSLTYS